VFPKDDKGFAVDDQYYVGGSGLLVKPVTAPSVESTQVYLSDNQVSLPAFYDVHI
jgi:alpha 1,3-glucosidase